MVGESFRQFYAELFGIAECRHVEFESYDEQKEKDMEDGNFLFDNRLEIGDHEKDKGHSRGEVVQYQPKFPSDVDPVSQVWDRE